MTDKVDASEGVNSSSVTEETSHEDHNQPTNKGPLSFLLPLPHLHSSVPSPVSPPSDQAFLQASIIFQQLCEEKPVTHQRLHYEKKTDTPLPASRDKCTRRQAYQLAFNTLKYQDLFANVITDSCFAASQHISSDLLPLAMVMLFDFQDRRFLLRGRSTKEGEEPITEVRAMESSLHRCKTKLAASLARCRVKHNLQSVSCFLSDSVRTKHRRAKCLPLYAWVNTLRTSVENMCEALQSAGLSEVKNIAELKESTFCRDPLCPDTLILSQHLHALLQHRNLTTTHVLNIQDRSLCVAVSVLRPLLFDNSDVLVVGSFSGVTVVHIAAVAAARSGRVLVCGADHTTLHVQEIQELLTEMDIKNVQILSEAFFSLSEWDTTVKHLKVIIVLPQCSSSALSDPVSTIHSEHGDWDLLPDLAQDSVSKRKIHTIAAQQAKLLAHALNFSKVQTVVYCTRSVYPEENEQLVKRVLEKTHTHPKLLPFRVNGPIFPDDSQSGDTADSKFFRLEPSQFTNGCFIARLSRQADPTKVETVHDVLARAAAKGLLGGIIPEQSKTVKKGKNRKNRVASASSKPPSPSGEERQAGRELVTGQDPVTPSEGRERGEEGEEHAQEEGKGEKKEEKNRGHKRKLKRQPKETLTASKLLPKSHKKKPTKKKVNQHPRRHLTKSKPRRIPRLTLTLMSSAKASKQLSPITAVAHKIIDTSVIKSQHTAVFIRPSPAGKHLPPPPPAPPALPAPRAASEQVKRQNAQGDRAEETVNDATKPARFEAMGKVVRPEIKAMTQEGKDTDFVLPPISSPCSSSLHSKSGSSFILPLSQTSHAQLSNMSTSSSSIYLPGL